MTQYYRLVFNGEVLEGHQIGDVKKKLASLLKTDERGIERFFSGKPNIIKKDVDYETAMKFRKVFEKAGAKLSLDMGKTPAQPEAEAVKEKSAFVESGGMTCPSSLASGIASPSTLYT